MPAIRRGSERRVLQNLVTIRLSPDQRTALRATAAAAGVTDAQFLRGLIARETGVPDDTPPRRRLRAPRPDWLHDLSRVAGALSAAGGLLRHTGHQAAADEVRDAALAAGAAVTLLVRAIDRGAVIEGEGN